METSPAASVPADTASTQDAAGEVEPEFVKIPFGCKALTREELDWFQNDFFGGSETFYDTPLWNDWPSSCPPAMSLRRRSI